MFLAGLIALVIFAFIMFQALFIFAPVVNSTNRGVITPFVSGNICGTQLFLLTKSQLESIGMAHHLFLEGSEIARRIDPELNQPDEDGVHQAVRNLIDDIILYYPRRLPGCSRN